MIPVFIPLITKRNIKSVLSTLVRGEISGNFGLAIKEFEKRFAEYIGCRFASTTSSGTTALHVAVSSLKLKKGSEILLSSSTNIATALAIVHNGHIPIPIDSNLNSWNIDLNKIKNINYFNIGIGDKNTEAYFNENIGNLKNDGSFRFTQNSNNEKINIYKLDDVFKNEKISLKENIIIKLDLEGFDFLALKGLSETLQKSKVIILIEISKMLLENTENFSNEFDLFIKNNKLNIYDLDFKNKNVHEIIMSLNAAEAKKETIGDYIISNHKLL